MATTVKISREYKEKLDRLQARLYLVTGKKLSLQEVLEILVSLGSEHEEIIVEKAQGEVSKLDSADIRVILDSPIDWGRETSEDTLDKILYGEKAF
jgi:mRNA-degrading endonuclease RelE of RelBE toxin-antitoxin system